LEIIIDNVNFSRIDSLEQMSFISDGFWQNDDVEIIRDKSFFEKRFFNIYNVLFMRDMYVKILFVILLYVWHTIKVFI